MNNWINIKDQLPPEKPFNSVYIVTIFSDLKLKYIVSPMHYIGGEWFEMYEEEPMPGEYEVTHWMALPDPPHWITNK